MSRYISQAAYQDAVRDGTEPQVTSQADENASWWDRIIKQGEPTRFEQGADSIEDAADSVGGIFDKFRDTINSLNPKVDAEVAVDNKTLSVLVFAVLAVVGFFVFKRKK